MTASDEIARLAGADPVPAGSLDRVPAPPPPRRRPRRAVGAVATGAGVLVLAGVIAALIIATPSGGDDPAAPPFDGTLRVSLLERPGPGAPASARLPAGIDPATVRRAGGSAATVTWYAARRTGRPASACLLSAGRDGVVRLVRCGSIARGLVAAVRREGARWQVAGLVPDGISTVQIGGTPGSTATVRGNLFVVTMTRRPRDPVVLTGPAAAVIPPSGGAAVAVPSGDPTPAVPVSLLPVSANGLPSPVEVTLAEAVAAMPFTVYVPATPPLPGEQRIERSPDDPRFFPQVTLTYLPAASGPGVSVIEGDHRGRPGPRGGERAVTRGGRELYVSGEGDPTGQVRVRLTIGGTDVQISGRLPSAQLLDVAASLRPAG